MCPNLFMPTQRKKLTADILTPEQMLKHRVVFFSATKNRVTLQTDREISTTRIAVLETLLGCEVSLRKVPDADETDKTGTSIRQIFYQILASCSMVLEPKVLGDLPTDIIVKYRVLCLGRDQQGRMILLTDRLLHNPEMTALSRICGGEIALEFVHNKPDYAEEFASIMEASAASMKGNPVDVMPASESVVLKPASRRIQHRGARKKATP